MVNGMIVIADEVANGKISDPYNESDTTLVESQFSFNSISDFQDNIRGIQNVYMGKFMTDGQGLNEFVNSHDPDLDARFQQEVQAAIDAIGAIPDPFRDSITANRGCCPKPRLMPLVRYNKPSNKIYSHSFSRASLIKVVGTLRRAVNT